LTAKRKQISKTLRFEIFKRDLFTCQYCGATPPAVVLHLDHIQALADGGADDEHNLITACVACNLGKGVRSLRSVPKSLSERASEISEREEQLRGYQEIIDGKRRRLESEADQVDSVFQSTFTKMALTSQDRVSVRRFIDRLGVWAVSEAMELACARWASSDNKAFKYFCGICWNRIREQNDG